MVDVNDTETKPPVWVLVGNIRQDTQRAGSPTIGTKHFSPGTKLWFFAPRLWGNDSERMLCIGRHRGGMRLVQMVVRARDVENFRVKHEWNPAIVERVRLIAQEDGAYLRAVAEHLNAGPHDKPGGYQFLPDFLRC